MPAASLILRVCICTIQYNNAVYGRSDVLIWEKKAIMLDPLRMLSINRLAYFDRFPAVLNCTIPFSRGFFALRWT